MPNLIYSKIKKDVPLLVINRFSEINERRIDVCPDTEYLQVSTKKMPKGLTFKPHKHNILERNTKKTQEGWIIFEGKVMASFWDIDDTLLFNTILEKGDCAIVFNAGHSFEVLEEDTILYEIKTGPYYGVEKDKSFIGDNE